MTEQTPAPPTHLTSGQLARAAGIGAETLRFYERRGLIDMPPRTASGRRLYPPSAVARLEFIRRAKGLGFTLAEIIGLLNLRVDAERSCADVARIAGDKLVDVRARIVELQRVERALEQLARQCESTGGARSACPILDALESEAQDV